MVSGISERLERSRRAQGGFTLIELLVVIIILGVLSAVVVFAVQGTGDKGASAAMATDAKTLRTAEEAYFANNGVYAEEDDLVTGGFLSEESTKHDVLLVGTGVGSYRITCSATEQGCGAGGANIVGGTIKVAGTSVLANVLGNNFVNPAVTSSGTVHPNVEYMYNGLMRWADDNTAQPDLAESFTINPDQTQATFTLRPGMVWHNGTPILNTDVSFTMREALFKFHSRTGPSMVPALGGTGGGTTSASVTAPNAIDVSVPGAVTFNFVYGYAPLLRQMNVTEAPILPENVYGPCRNDGAGPGTDNIQFGNPATPTVGACPANNPADGDWPSPGPVGSGPFRLKSRNSLTAELNFVKRSLPGGIGATPYHLPGLPFADNLVQVPVTPQLLPTLVAEALLAKTVDVGNPHNDRILPIVPPNQTIADITPDNGFTLANVPRGPGGGNCITTFAFHLWKYGTPVNTIGAKAPNAPYEHEFFGDPTPVDVDGPGGLAPMPRGKVVRRAISMALDRTAIFNAVQFGKGRVPDSPYHSNLPPYQAQASFPQFDTATADTWLNAAGWTVVGGIRRFTGTVIAGVTPAANTALAWQVRRVGGTQDAIYLQMETQLAAPPVSIDIDAGVAPHNEVGVDSGTPITGALVGGNRNYDMLVVSYCAGDDPVIGVRRQYHSDGIPLSGNPSAFTNPAGVRSTVMDGFWNTAFGASYTSKHQQIQAMSADDAYQIYFDETSTTRAWRSGCSGFNNFNTGLYVETASCS